MREEFLSGGISITEKGVLACRYSKCPTSSDIRKFDRPCSNCCARYSDNSENDLLRSFVRVSIQSSASTDIPVSRMVSSILEFCSTTG